MVAVASPWSAVGAVLYASLLVGYIVVMTLGWTDMSRAMVMVFVFELVNVSIPGSTDFWWTVR